MAGRPKTVPCPGHFGRSCITLGAGCLPTTAFPQGVLQPPNSDPALASPGRSAGQLLAAVRIWTAAGGPPCVPAWTRTTSRSTWGLRAQLVPEVSLRPPSCLPAERGRSGPWRAQTPGGYLALAGGSTRGFLLSSADVTPSPPAPAGIEPMGARVVNQLATRARATYCTQVICRLIYLGNLTHWGQDSNPASPALVATPGIAPGPHAFQACALLSELRGQVAARSRASRPGSQR